MLHQIHNNKKGIAALLVVVILSAAGVVIAYTASVIGLTQLEISFTGSKGLEALSIAEGCAEETLHRIRLDNNYGVGAGTINLSLGGGSCIINVTDLGGSQRQIDVTGTVSAYNKVIRLQITITVGVITVDSWEEITT